jgi:AcrR family transcriptional regulator
MADIQRNRMLAATIELIDDGGYPTITVAQIIAKARVSRLTFYREFDNRDECFLVAFDQTLTHALQSAASAYADAPCWHAGVRAALECLVGLMDEQRSLARLWVIETPRGGDRVLKRRVRALDALARVVDEARQMISERSQPPANTAEGVVGAAVAMIHRRLLTEPDAPLSEMVGAMMNLIVLPYLGPREARAQLRAGAQPRARPPAPPLAKRDPLLGLGMRVTHRTMRVLDVISKFPGASNREIAQRAGIVDEGQISKLLGRLARLALIENWGVGHAKGGSNAWQLTKRGRDLADAMLPVRTLR